MVCQVIHSLNEVQDRKEKRGTQNQTQVTTGKMYADTQSRTTGVKRMGRKENRGSHCTHGRKTNARNAVAHRVTSGEGGGKKQVKDYSNRLLLLLIIIICLPVHSVSLTTFCLFFSPLPSSSSFI